MSLNTISRPHKLVRLLSVFSAAIVASCSSAWPSQPTFSAATENAARSYVETLPADQKVMVWPSQLRSYKITSDGAIPAAVIDEYIKNRDGPFKEFRNPVFQNISIFLGPYAANVDMEAMRSKNIALPSSLRGYALAHSSGEQKCEADLEFSRNTWINAGVGIIFSGQGKSAKDCAYAVLDYLNGFPMKNNVFTYDSELPPPDVRLAVMWAFWDCSVAPSTGGHPVERTRAGVAPFPTKSCALQNLLHSR